MSGFRGWALRILCPPCPLFPIPYSLFRVPYSLFPIQNQIRDLPTNRQSDGESVNLTLVRTKDILCSAKGIRAEGKRWPLGIGCEQGPVKAIGRDDPRADCLGNSDEICLQVGNGFSIDRGSLAD